MRRLEDLRVLHTNASEVADGEEAAVVDRLVCQAELCGAPELHGDKRIEPVPGCRIVGATVEGTGCRLRRGGVAGEQTAERRPAGIVGAGLAQSLGRSCQLDQAPGAQNASVAPRDRPEACARPCAQTAKPPSIGSNRSSSAPIVRAFR